MPWLTPPTDNLYKFMAVFGIVLVVTGFVMKWQAERSYKEAYTSLLVEANKVAEQESVKWEKVGSLLDQLGRVDVLTEEGRRQHSKIIQEMEAPELHRTLADYKRSPTYIRAEQKFDEASAEYVNSVNYLFLSIAGAVLSAAGFYLWFTRLQRLLDQQLAGAVGHERPIKAE